jgi:hypothetical protein
MIVKLLVIHLNKQKFVKIASKTETITYKSYLTIVRKWGIYLAISTSSVNKKSSNYFWKHWTKERFLVCVLQQAKHGPKDHINRLPGAL